MSALLQTVSISLALLFTWKSASLAEEPIRMWRSADGSKSFLGRYISSDGEKVTIEKEGESFTFSISRLSEKDQAIIADKLNPKPKPKPLPAETGTKVATGTQGFSLNPQQKAAIVMNVKSQGASAADVFVEKEEIRLVFAIPFGTSKARAREIGENFVRLTMTLSDDVPPAKTLVKGKYSYLVGGFTPDQKWLVMGHKRAGVPKIIW